MVFFRHMFFKQPPKLQEKRIDGKRHYISPTGKILPSVTTVLSLIGKEGLEFWKKKVGEEKAKEISERAMAEGTEMHSLIEDYLNNKTTMEKKSERSHKLFEQLKPNLDKINNIYALEIQLFSDRIGVAGRTDCIAEYNRELSVIDFKTSRQKKRREWINSYFLQATCYSLMFEESQNMKIENLVIMISSDDGTVEVFVEKRDKWVERLLGVIEDYKLRVEFGDGIRTTTL